ncbi:hypothetical protein J5N97_028019 [Dioscorea zingiberensis]|uniref:URB1 N-terminal domain-containing protein n=1 Tax=Dioscorea zingiberensis TaxID=325984 RepID=A0A9D5H4E0_9LILI|nr:hypothetical protein J5N97_028019 [Dioscorea zingiberensis]
MGEDEAIIADEDLDAIEDLDPEVEVTVEDGEELGASNGEEDVEETSGPTNPAVYKPMIVKILRDLQSPEIKIYSVAAKEFVDLLGSDSGGEVLLEYVKSSPGCAELFESWRAHCGKPGMAYILNLFASVLDHPLGKTRSSGICRNLDNFARTIVGTKLDDIYSELNSQESRRQSAGLRLLASVIKRGMSLASEVAKVFNFKLPVFTKLSGAQRKSSNKGGREKDHRGRRSTRNAFVLFAMSFLEVGNPRLLRWVLQQREMYSGVLQVLGSDDAETVVYILSTLRDKVLIPKSLVPPGLRSVLFGSVSLEQLSYVSGNLEAGVAADIAHEVLVKVCTDPVNGLMPSSTGKGNEKRLFELMKKLKATEAQYHKDLLLAIVKCRPSLCSAYLDDFPYHLEPRPSSLWFAAISLAADIISSVNTDTLIASIESHPHGVKLDELQNILKCITPRAFTRPVINKGLLHPDILVKHGSLRVLLESVKLVGKLTNKIDDIIEGSNLRSIMETPRERMVVQHGLPGLRCFADIDRFLGMDTTSYPHADEQGTVQWVSIKQHIQDEVRVLLPDPQVLVKLLSTPSSRDLRHGKMSLKRGANLTESSFQKLKKLKSESINENIDLVICGVDDELTTDTSENQKKAKFGFTENELEVEKASKMTLSEIWGLNNDNYSMNELRDPEIYLYSKLLDVLTFYLRTMPTSLDSTFDFFKILPADPLNLSLDQQQSLFSLLIEYIGQSPGSRVATRAPELMYRHLQPLISTLVFSEDTDVRDQAYKLARAAMISTGAFDWNLLEVDAWLAFIPGFNVKFPGMAEMFTDWSKVIISFLCDAVSTVGNNLYKHMDNIRQLILEINGHSDMSPDFSALTICILQKCLRILDSDSGTFKLHEKSSISLYVCSTLVLISQMEVGTTILPCLIQLVLAEKFNYSCSNCEGSKESLCEWMPLRNLLLFASNMVDQLSCSSFCPLESTSNASESSFISILENVKEFLRHDHAGGHEGLAVALSSSILCASPDDILKTFPLLIMTSQLLFKSHLQLLSWAFFSDPKFLVNVANQWSDMFFSAFEMIGVNISYDNNDDGDTRSNEDTEFILRSIYTDHVNQTESAAVAFSLLLKQSPFYVLLSGIMSFGSCKLDSSKILGVLQSTRILDLLRVKLFEGPVCMPISYLRCLLFWTRQILSAYRAKPCDVLEELFHLCFTLIEHFLEHLVAKLSDAANSKTLCKSIIAEVQDAIDLVIHHPAITLSFLCPLSVNKKFQRENSIDCVEAFLTSSKQSYHPMDQRVLQFSKKVIDVLTITRNGCSTSNLDYTSIGQILKAPIDLVEKTELLFKEKFEFCVMMRDLGPLLPSFYAFHSLVHLKSSFELLQLVYWMFCKLDNDRSGYVSAYVPAVCVALFIADIALDMLYSNLKQPTTKSQRNQILDLSRSDFDVSSLKNIYYKILDFARFFNLQCADQCLFKIVNSAYKQKLEKPQPAMLPLYMLSLRMIVGCPIKMFLHLFYPASRTKAKTLLHLIEASSVHMSLFGKMFTGIVNNDLSVVDVLNMSGACPVKGEMTIKRGNDILLEDDFVLMLPAALSYLTYNIHEIRKQDFKIFENILAFYSRILLDGFSNWKSYVSGDIFHEVFDDLELKPSVDFSQLFSSSLLEKAVLLLQYAFVLNRVSIGTLQRLKIFDSIYPHSYVSDEMLDGELKSLTLLLLMNP